MGAVMSISYGIGNRARYMKGSEFNDQMYSEDGKVKFISNNSGGIQGGITNGQDIRIELTIRPTPSISKEQKTVDLNGNNTSIMVEGRHDPCLCSRIVPVAEALTAIVLIDQMKSNGYIK
jgi:chorismate synthase